MTTSQPTRPSRPTLDDGTEPYAAVRPATDEELARLAQDWRVWQRPEVKQWLATGEWPDEDEGDGEGA